MAFGRKPQVRSEGRRCAVDPLLRHQHVRIERANQRDDGGVNDVRVGSVVRAGRERHVDGVADAWFVSRLITRACAGKSVCPGLMDRVVSTRLLL